MREPTVIDATDLVRSVLYIWASFEAFLLAYLYHFGYDKLKKTPIIGALKGIFFILGLYFVFLSLLPILKVFNKEVWEIAVPLLTIPLFFIIYCLRKFRHWSLNTKNKKK
jgi:predicted transporter